MTRSRRQPGSARPPGTCAGTVALAVTARDAGGGVYERGLDVDGRRVTTARLCPTVRATLGSQRHVTRRVPCPLDAPATVAVDTRAFADGAHTLAARVEDVAGNARSASTRILIDNRPPRAGTVALGRRPGRGADRAAERLQR